MQRNRYEIALSAGPVNSEWLDLMTDTVVGK